MRKKTILMVLMLLALSVMPLCAESLARFGLMLDLNTNMFSDPLPKYVSLNWVKNKMEDPFVLKDDVAGVLILDFFPSRKSRLGLSIFTSYGKTFYAKESKPDWDGTEASGRAKWDGEYTSEEVDTDGMNSLFFAGGPSFRAKVDKFDLGFSVRLSLGTYEMFEDGLILGVQSEPFLNYHFSDKWFFASGLLLDLHFMRMYLDSDSQVYDDNYIILTAGGFVGLGFAF